MIVRVNELTKECTKVYIAGNITPENFIKKNSGCLIVDDSLSEYEFLILNEDYEVVPDYKRIRERDQLIFKAKRELILNSTDKMMIPDFPIVDIIKEQLKTFRQELRDFTTAANKPYISNELNLFLTKHNIEYEYVEVK